MLLQLFTSGIGRKMRQLEFVFLIISISFGKGMLFDDVTELRFHTESVLKTTSSHFISMTIDSNVSQANWGNLDFRSKKLQAIAEALSPCYLRMGGNKADFLIFSMNGTESVGPESNSYESKHMNKQDLQQEDAALRFVPLSNTFGFEKKRNYTNFTMTASMWDDINHFMTKVGWDFLFDLNVFLRKDGQWDSDNAKLLLKYTASKGYRLAGWELGNEPDDFHGYGFDIPAAQLAKDYSTMKNLLSSLPDYENFQIMGPSVTQLLHVRSQIYFSDFLQNGGKNTVTSPTFHHYYVDGKVATIEDFLSPYVLDGLAPEIITGNKIVAQYAPGKRVWLGETSSAWGGGATGLSDRYVAGFMWLDKLGVAASQGIEVVIRQAFYGARYGLIDWQTLEPNPDYWLSVLYKKLVGSKVLLTDSSDKTGHLRVYAHCSTDKYPAGSVTVYVLNLWTASVNITSSLFENQDLHMFLLHSDGDLRSQDVYLNGKLLHMEGDALPDLMTPTVVHAPVPWPGQTFGFLVLPNAKAKACI
ncbi:heparanase-like isoform X1 [Mizuhopecten yessoensis]|uniref:heparanase-like isoform X1 n=1 Tax=Mizuhopecten yessoensis TaxID=6573 RepID=UPI000B45E3D3|nr:heparanase-like isoform X1 [Mizuhopecten yessoensis]